jgi:hypothetical protein
MSSRNLSYSANWNQGRESCLHNVSLLFKAGRAKVPYINCIRKARATVIFEKLVIAEVENIRRSTHVRDPPENRRVTPSNALYQIIAREMQAPVPLLFISD